MTEEIGKLSESTTKVVESIADKLLAREEKTEEKPKAKAEHTTESTELDPSEDIPNDLLDGPLPGVKMDELAPEPAAEEDIEVVDKEAFIKLRTKFKTKINSLEEELKQAKAQGESKEDINVLRKELAETRKRLGAYALAEDPDFKERYDKPIQLAYNQALEVVRSLDGKDGVIAHAFSLPYKDRIKYLDENVPHGTSLILPFLSQLDILSKSKSEALGRFEEEKRQMAQMKFEREKAHKDDLVGRSFNAALNQVVEAEKYPFLRKSSVDDKWNKTVDQRITFAKKIATSEDPYVRAEASLKATMTNEYKYAFEKAASRVRELEKELGIRSKMKSGGSTGSVAPASKNSDKKERPKTAKDVADFLTREFS